MSEIASKTPEACGAVQASSLSVDRRLQDFHHLFQVLRDNYPFFWSKQRYEEHFWPAHEKEFEESVRKADTDERFAKAIYRMVKLLNNGHTNFGGLRDAANSSVKRWVAESQKTTPERASYWTKLAGVENLSGSFTGRGPFAAIYNAGDYLVAGVSPEVGVSGKVEPGMKVASVCGLPVHEYVAGRRGETWLKYDPMRKRVYVRRLTLPSGPDPVEATFGGRQGNLVNVTLPSTSAATWPDPYAWPPKYARQDPGSKVYADVMGGAIGYVQVRQMGSRPEDSQMLREFFQSVRTLPALIIDIRGNGGGSDLFWIQNLFGLLATAPTNWSLRFAWRASDTTREFLNSKFESMAAMGLQRDMFVELNPSGQPGVPPELLTPAFDKPVEGILPLQPMNSTGYKGRIFLLVDDDVFSSAESFSAFCKASGWATLVGGYTGGDGIGFDPSIVVLPNSGICIRYSTTFGLNPDWTVNEQVHTRPDILVEPSSEDLLKYLRLQANGPLPGPDPDWDTALRECLKAAS